MAISRLAGLFVVCLVAVGGIGCASYAPPEVDAKTGLYSTLVQVDESATREFDTTINPSRFRFVALNAESNVFPARFEFFVREAFANLGLVKVLNKDELVALVKSHPKLSTVNSVTDPLALKQISDQVGPMMIVDVSSTWDGNVSRHVILKVVDASSGRTLLHVDHNRLILYSVDPEAHYPVLNKFREWYKASTQANAI